MLHSKIYLFEGMLAAKVEYECKMRGAQRMEFNPIVGGGLNASVIHCLENNQKLNLVIITKCCLLVFIFYYSIFITYLAD
ncbi:hypothetical protein AAHE18_05G186900 [Arachis hypogaea]